MSATTKIRATRTALLITLIAGLALGAFGLLLGIGLPGLILSVIGWIAFIIALVWLIIVALRRASASSPASPWRPGDHGSPR
ncbi:MAG TPA: hypothetical protein VK095_02785 [Beutenbergiaceae bacterium]|nr:hypothetical protein [Beutenbergiaceae bacterium]